MVASSTVELTGAAGPAADLLSVLADPVRWSVLARLAEGPCCVCELQAELPIAANLLSYHLRVLREAGLVLGTRRGRWVDYALAGDAHDRMRAALPGAAARATG